jgi:hypothetical protein
VIDAADIPIVITTEPLLVAASAAARMCGVAERTWRKLDRMGRTPRAVAVGRRRLWPVAHLRQWAELGCPERHAFESRRGAE